MTGWPRAALCPHGDRSCRMIVQTGMSRIQRGGVGVDGSTWPVLQDDGIRAVRCRRLGWTRDGRPARGLHGSDHNLMLAARRPSFRSREMLESALRVGCGRLVIRFGWSC